MTRSAFLSILTLSLTIVWAQKIAHAEPKIQNHLLRKHPVTRSSIALQYVEDLVGVYDTSSHTMPRGARTLKNTSKEKRDKYMKGDKKTKMNKDNSHKMKSASNAETKTKQKSNKKASKTSGNSKSGKKGKKGKSSGSSTYSPSDSLTVTPTSNPTVTSSSVPSDAPSLVPSLPPSNVPSDMPSLVPSSGPTISWDNRLTVCLCDDVNSCLPIPVAPLDATAEFRFCVALPDDTDVAALWIEDLKLTRPGLYSEDLLQDESVVIDGGLVECELTDCIFVAPFSPELFIPDGDDLLISEVIAEGTVGIETLTSERKLVDFSHPIEVLVSEEDPAIIVEKDVANPSDGNGYGKGNSRGIFFALGVAVAVIAGGGLIYYYRKVHKGNNGSA